MLGLPKTDELMPEVPPFPQLIIGDGAQSTMAETNTTNSAHDNNDAKRVMVCNPTDNAVRTIRGEDNPSDSKSVKEKTYRPEDEEPEVECSEY